jgi:predicted RNase H-like HicB family nuclease
MDYIAYLHKDRTSDFGVSFPDFPGCVTAGKTLDEARRLAGEALMLHIKGLIEDGEAVPEPSTLDDLAEDPDMRGAVAILVGLEPPEKTVRVNITARESQLEKIDRLAAKAGLTRSAYMIRASTAGAFVKRERRTGSKARRVSKKEAAHSTPPRHKAPHH